MTKWKTISVSLFLLSIFIFVVFSLVQLTPMYGPPDEMARDTTRRLQETALVLSAIGILIVGSIVSYLVGWKQSRAPHKRE
ncbi:hypothetical protein [Methanoregula sp.]|uniref:hypothetical protein n=1 Tax=Methanoregula sp. TaxID=2052170 RepID=UPI003BAF0DCA